MKDAEDHPGRIEIPIPEGFAPPSPYEPGKPIEIVDSWEIKPDGKTMCLVKLGEHDAPGYGSSKAEPEAENKPGYDGMAKGMMSEQPAGAAAGY